MFGKRYREVIRGWEASVVSGGSNNKRYVVLYIKIARELTYISINWAGTALNAFYAAVRKALIVVIVLRALGILFAMGIGSWWFLKRGVND